MNAGRTPGLETLALGPGRRIYHFSKDLDGLLASGRFDPGRSAYGAAMFFTDKPAGDTNCMVEIVEPCLITDLDSVRTADERTRPYIGLQLANRAVGLGLDGFRNEKMAGLTRQAGGSYAAEIIILRESLDKLVPRVFEAEY